MTTLRFRIHAVLQMDERAISVSDVWLALASGTEIETRPDDHPYPARLVLGFTPTGAVHIAVRDNIVDDEIIVETVYRPSPDLWAPDLKTRRRLR